MALPTKANQPPRSWALLIVACVAVGRRHDSPANSAWSIFWAVRHAVDAGPFALHRPRSLRVPIKWCTLARPSQSIMLGCMQCCGVALKTARVARKAEPEAEVVVKAMDEFDGDLLEAVRVLELSSPKVSDETVREAYRRLARIEHPDVSARPDADRRFRRISIALDLLTNDAGRALVSDSVVEAEMQEKERQATQIEVEVSSEILVFVGLFLVMFMTALVATSLGAGNFR